MSNKDISMTPPPTPQSDSFTDESLDYMDYFNASAEKPEKSAADNAVEDDIGNKEAEGRFMFSCKGESHPKTNNLNGNYIGSLALYNLLHFSNPLHGTTSPRVLDNYLQPLGCHINFEQIFLIIRKNIQVLERGSETFASSNYCGIGSNNKTPFALREEVINFLKAFSYFLTENKDQEICRQILVNILDLLKFLGPMYALPQHVTNAHSAQGNKCMSSAYHLLHLNLDVRWWSLAILLQVDSSVSYLHQEPIQPFIKELHTVASDDTGPSPLDSCISFLLWDLITLIERQVFKASICELRSVPGFPCTCSHELAVTVLHLLEHRNKINKSENFWGTVKEKLLLSLKIISDTSLDLTSRQCTTVTFPPPNMKTLQLHHMWWVYINLAKLFLFDVRGNPVPPKSPSVLCEPKLLRTLIRLTLNSQQSSQQPSEQELRFYMTCCHSLTQIWPCNKTSRHSDWIVPLWDYYSKNLDFSFVVHGSSLEGFATLCKTPSSMIALVQSLLTVSSIGKNDNSWHIFLRILVAVAQENELEWRTLGGRIYSKFFAKKMAELSPTGLYNTILLYLVLAASSSGEEFAKLCVKLCDLLCAVPHRVSKINKVLLGLLSAAYLLISRSSSLEPICDKLSKYLASVVNDYITAVDSIVKRDIGQNISMYCDGVQEILGITANLSYGQSKLLCPALNTVLNQASITETKSILGCINVALIKVMESTKNIHAVADGTGLDMIEMVWTNFEHNLKTLCLSLTPPLLVAPIMSNLVLCSARYASVVVNKSAVTDCAATLLPYLIENEAISHRLSMVFISNLFLEENIQIISNSYPKYEEKAVVLLLSALVLHGSTDEIITAKEAIFALPGMVQLIEDAPACPFGAFQMLAQAMANHYKNAESFQIRMSVRDKAFIYFTNLEKSIGSLLKKTHFPTHLREVFTLIGCLFTEGHPVLYVKGKPTCPLPGILRAAILPTAVYKLDKPLGTPLTQALTPCLPKVILGLSSLSPLLDPYISRCIKDIFSSYIHRFSFLSHPFIEVFCEDTENTRILRQLFIETVRQSHLSSVKFSVVHRQVVLSLLLELLQLNCDMWLELLCTGIFSSLLETLLHDDDNSVRRCVTELLQKLFSEACKNQSDTRLTLVKNIRLFVMSQLAWASARVFRILDVLAALNKPLIMDSLPDIVEAIHITEEKRGSGMDQTLRRGYNSLLSRLGIEQNQLL